ncbi:hypothetical protein BKA83DRAFT_4366040 [Pisolithus microcarpus]|nr:hypothetical protein BKA83DRAFT_4366040 [Pisolithus microcarpus]
MGWIGGICISWSVSLFRFLELVADIVQNVYRQAYTPGRHSDTSPPACPLCIRAALQTGLHIFTCYIYMPLYIRHVVVFRCL